MFLFRRVLLCTFLAVAPNLTSVARSDAATKGCDPKCEQLISWYWAASLFQAREWYATVIAHTSQAQCVAAHESASAGLYAAQNAHSSASGKYQMLDSTGDNVARAMRAPELVGRPARNWPWYMQDLGFGVLWAETHGAAWAYECGSAPLGG